MQVLFFSFLFSFLGNGFMLYLSSMFLFPLSFYCGGAHTIPRYNIGWLVFDAYMCVCTWLQLTRVFPLLFVLFLPFEKYLWYLCDPISTTYTYTNI